AALQRYYREDPDPAVKRSLIAAADWLYRALDKNRIGWSYGTGWDGQLFWPATQGLNLLTVPGMMAGGQLADSREIYDAARMVLVCARMTGLNYIGKELSLRTCVLPLLYEEMESFRARHPEAGAGDALTGDLMEKFRSGTSDGFRMRGPENMAFEVLACRPAEITVVRNTTGTRPAPRPEFKCKVTGKDGKVLASFGGRIRTAGKWKVDLPAKGLYKVEVEDSCTGVWDVISPDCRVRAELRKGYLFVNGGVSRQNIVIPGGTKKFTLEFFGAHEGRCSAFLFDPDGKLAGGDAVVTSGRPRLPWFKGAETLPKGRIDVKVKKPSPKETLWKLVVFAGGSVRMDLIGAEGKVELGQNEKNTPRL
ncbi:MAG: hypothetical protein IJT50_11725, partial [Lentisphaeria bacterium]|nr:hypothetical protein [Lentisphaeria bacterium]